MEMYQDRIDAGVQLAESLLSYKNRDVVVLAIPRGGVVVAAEVAKALEAPLDLVIPRKIGAPGNEELAIGAVAGADQVIINEPLAKSLRVSDDYLQKETVKQLMEIKRRRRLYLGESKEHELTGKVAILVDDGLATGSTAKAAIMATRLKQPRKLVLAIPVAPRDTVETISKMVDELVCLKIPGDFFAVGQFYNNFDQVNDIEVVEILTEFKKTA